jgi:hypothetical protein
MSSNLLCFLYGHFIVDSCISSQQPLLSLCNLRLQTLVHRVLGESPLVCRRCFIASVLGGVQRCITLTLFYSCMQQVQYLNPEGLQLVTLFNV